MISPTIQHRIVLVLLGALAPSLASAEIYKSLGPDGQVVYSNVAPKNKDTPVAILQAPAGQQVAIRSPARPKPQPVAHSGNEMLTPDVVGAVANVMGMSHLVSTARDFCVAAAPASLKRYSSAATAWQQRNAVVVAKKDKVLSVSDRGLIGSALSGDMRQLTEDMMRPIKQAGIAERIKWCDKTIEDVDRGMLDLVGRASISPLMNYTLR
jgi:hypothetical protein